MKKKLVALLMAVLMMVSVLPVSAFAFSFGDYVSYRSSLLQSGREYLQSLFFGWQGAAEETPAEEPAPAEEPPAEEPEEAEEESLPLLTSVPKLTTPAPVTYIGADGNKATVSSYTDIPNGFSTTEWAEGTYVVSGDNVQINSSVTLNGDVTLILLDGAKLTIVGTADNGTSGDFPTPQAGLGVNAIDGVAYSLTVTAGATGDTILGTGELDATGGGATRTQPQNWPYICEPRSGIAVKNFTLNGGKVIAKTGARLGDLSGGYASPAPGLYVAETLTVNSGELEAYNTNVVKDNRATAINADQFLLNGGSVYAEGGSEMQEVLYVTSLTLAGGKLTALNDTTGGKAFSSAPTITGNVESCKVGENSSSPTDWDNNTALTSYQYVSLEVTTAATQAITVDGITFQPWTTATSLPTAGGSWYLDTDVTLSGWCNVATGTDSKHTVTNLCLNGHMISASDSGCYIIVADYAELNLYDCATATDHTGHLDEDGKWCSGAGATPTNVKGGIITGFNNAVYVKDNGSFTMYGGTLCGNNTGIGVTTGGTAVMNGGTVSYNAMDSGVGAGVSMDDGSFTLNDGVISHNTVNDKDSGGGGVYIGGGLFQMNGGEISYNSARDGRGGGVCVNPGHGDVTFNMAGGTISSNTALIAGGVNLTQTKTNAVFHMTGGSIVNNVATGACGGVLSFNATFSLSDEVFIKDNTAPDGMPQNLATTVPITVGKLATESEIYVAHMDTNKIAYDTGVLTASYTDMNSGAKVDDFFHYDGPATYEMVLNAAGELEVVEKTHTHDGITFATPIANEDDLRDLVSDGGSGYLTADIATDGTKIGSNTDLCLNGHTLTLAAKAIVVSEGVTFTLYDCDERASETNYTHKFSVASDTGLWTLNEATGTKIVTGGVITTMSEDENIVWVSGGSFIMNGGALSGAKNGGVNVNSGSFVMTDGTICGNTDSGVNVSVDGSFTMNGGAIRDNTAKAHGGGVYVKKDAEFTMNGGAIRDNTSGEYGGGVENNGSFTITGGTITGNTAKIGGGIFNQGGFTMTGGAISNNTAVVMCGGACVGSDKAVVIGGTAQITGNTAGNTASPSNLMLAGCKATLATGTDVPKTGMNVGVTVVDMKTNQPVAASFTNLGATASDTDFFTSDVDTYQVQYNAAGYLELAEKTHTHDDVEFQPWTNSTSLPADGGNWYLDCDVTLSDEWNVATGTDSKHTVTNLCLNGHVITGVSNKYIVVEDYAELNLYDCATATDHTGHLDENGKWCSGAGATPTNVKGGIITGFEAVFTYNYGSFTMNGGTICGNKTGFGVGRYGTAVMNGGMVAYNYQPEGGAGGVGVAEGSFTLNDGVICYNTCNDEIYYHGGGGVYVNHGGSFTMNGGTVSHNKAENVLGGGVLIENSTFTMLDGVISDNTAPYGGGVFIRKNSIASGDVTISGGSIIRNMATSAVGGVFADSNSVTLSGKVVIKDNTAPDGIPQDLATTTPITVGKLATESEIYAAHADPMYGKYDTGVLTASYSDMNSGAKVDDFFLYDGPDTYEMVLNAAGELEVKMVPVTYVTRSWNDSKVVSTSATCTDYTVVTDETDTFESGWYVVSTDTTIEDRIEVDGTANLILCNGATLTAKAGIEVADGKTLNIYGQSGDSGKLIATGADKSAGIGGSGQGAASGNVTIYGGTVITTGT